MYGLVLVVIALIMAWILQVVFKNMKIKGEYWNRFIGAVIGALLGDLLLGNWGWMLAGYNVIAGIIGSFLIGWLYMYVYINKVQK